MLIMYSSQFGFNTVLSKMLWIITLLLCYIVPCPALSSFSNETIDYRRHRRASPCILPEHPANGIYTSNVANGAPGQFATTLKLQITCRQGYGVVGNPDVYCSEGAWSQPVPQCVPFCKLNKHPSIHYRCLVRGSVVGERACNSYEPTGTVVRPECNTPNYYASEVLTFMECIEGSWDYVPRCSPECGRVTPDGAQLIAGGRLAKKGELPWHTAIYSKTFTPYMQICGGSLITDSVVISAAHCFYLERLLPASEFSVAVGKLYRPYDARGDETDVQKSDVKEIKIGARFQGRKANFQDDIAILYLAKSFEFQTNVRPVCLDFNYDFDRRQLVPGNKGKVAGWGLTDTNSPASQILKVVELPYIDISYCISKAPPAFGEYITSDKICAGYENNGTAVCQGDSGGGLAFPATDRGTERYYLRGIVSTAPNDGNLCNTQSITTFTQVIKHEQFIKHHLYSYRYSAGTETINKCRQDEWTCGDQTCVSMDKKCNGVVDCPDNSDEVTSLCGVKNNIELSSNGQAEKQCSLYVNSERCKETMALNLIHSGGEVLLGSGETRGNISWGKYTGALITNKYILTSAVRAVETLNFVAVGIEYRTRVSEDQQILAVKRRIIHPEYKAYPRQHDIALLETDETIEFKHLAIPACLPSKQTVDDVAVRITWRKRYDPDSDSPNSLIMSKYTEEECRAAYGHLETYNYTTQTCYGSRQNLESGCYTYSGDPLVVETSNCINTVIGLTMEWSCQKPVLFIRVSAYVPWIESVVWP